MSRSAPRSTTKRPARFEPLENRNLLAADGLFLQNPLDALDINFDGNHTVQDVSALVQRIHLLTEGVEAPIVGNVQAFLDANGDGHLAINDLAPVVRNLLLESEATAAAIEEVVVELADSADATADRLQQLVDQRGERASLHELVDEALAELGPIEPLVEARFEQLVDVTSDQFEQLRGRLGEVFQHSDPAAREALLAELRTARQTALAELRAELSEVLQPLVAEGELELAGHAEAAQQHVAAALNHAADLGEQRLAGQIDRLLTIIQDHEIELPAEIVSQLEAVRDGDQTPREAVHVIVDFVRENLDQHHDTLVEGIDQLLRRVEEGTVEIPPSVVQLLTRIRDGETPVRDLLETLRGSEQPVRTALDEVIDRAESGEVPLPEDVLALLTRFRDQLPPADQPFRSLLGRLGQAR